MEKVAHQVRNGLQFPVIKVTKNYCIQTKQLSATIYIDGACSRNGLDGARAGIGIYWPNNPMYNISEPYEGRQTNQCAEIAAAIRGLRQAKSLEYRHVRVLTDSHYVKNAAETWIPNWVQNGWRRFVANMDLFQDLCDAMHHIDATFEYVPSHLNLADPLAKQGAAEPMKKATI